VLVLVQLQGVRVFVCAYTCCKEYMCVCICVLVLVQLQGVRVFVCAYTCCKEYMCVHMCARTGSAARSTCACVHICAARSTCVCIYALQGGHVCVCAYKCLYWRSCLAYMCVHLCARTGLAARSTRVCVCAQVLVLA